MDSTNPPRLGYRGTKKIMAKALLSFSILVDHDDAGVGQPAREVRSEIKLYRENGALVWRMAGELGDEVEVLPRRPANVAAAKADVRATYGRDGAGVWKLRAAWA